MFIRIVVSKNIGTLKGRRKPLLKQRFPAVEFDFRPHGSSPPSEIIVLHSSVCIDHRDAQIRTYVHCEKCICIQSHIAGMCPNLNNMLSAIRVKKSRNHVSLSSESSSICMKGKIFPLLSEGGDSNGPFVYIPYKPINIRGI